MSFEVVDGPLERGAHVVEVRGEINLVTFADVKASLEAAIDAEAQWIILDLEDVGFVDSSGVGLLLATQRRLQAGGGTLIVVCPNPLVRNIFERCGIVSYVNVVDTRREALTVAQSFTDTC
jgi:anti-anti-sigma factor